MSAEAQTGARRDAPRRRIPFKALLWGLAALVIVAMALDTAYRAPGEKVGPGGREAFDPAKYGAQTFEAKVLPALRKKAVPLDELLPELQKDADAAGKEFGTRQGSSPYNFVVTAEGTAGKAEGGLLPVKVSGTGDVDVALQVGPAINGTAIRDASGVVSFDQFVNQVDYAGAATALNNEVKAKVLKGFDAAAADGKQVSFTGAFTFLAPTSATVTPIELKVSG